MMKFGSHLLEALFIMAGPLLLETPPIAMVTDTPFPLGQLVLLLYWFIFSNTVWVKASGWGHDPNPSLHFLELLALQRYLPVMVHEEHKQLADLHTEMQGVSRNFSITSLGWAPELRTGSLS